MQFFLYMKLIGSPGTELMHILATYIMCPCNIDYWPIFPKIGSRDPEVSLKYPILKCEVSVPVARQPALSWQPFCAPLVGGLPHVRFQGWTWYDHPVLSYYNFLLDMLRYVVTLTFDILTLESCHVMPVWCSIRVPSLNWIRLTVPEFGRLKFSIDRQLKVPIFTFFGRKGGQISNLIVRTPKRHYLGGKDV